MKRIRCRNGQEAAGTILRYIDPHNDKAIADPELVKQWLPVDIYIGGAEHAVLHLLYARFWHKVLIRYWCCSDERAIPKAIQPRDDSW